MHYVSSLGKHVEVDVTERGEYILGGREPRVLHPSEVATGYAPAEDRRSPLRQRRSQGRLKIGRRHRDHTSAAQDIELARSRELVRKSGEYRLGSAA